jgi:hypothetical protein
MTPSLIGELDAALGAVVPMLEDHRARIIGDCTSWTLRDEQAYTHFVAIVSKIRLLASGKPVVHEMRPGHMAWVERRALELFQRGAKVWLTIDPPVRGTETTPGKGGEYVLRWEE